MFFMKTLGIKRREKMNERQTILLVEDDEVDIRSIKRALEDLHVVNPLVVTNNGEEALEYLRNKANRRPGLILLDLRMPKMDGIEFLKIAKNDDKLKIIPVVALTSSKEEGDKINSFKLGVAGYMMKPVDYMEFVEVIRAIQMYWILSESP